MADQTSSGVPAEYGGEEFSEYIDFDFDSSPQPNSDQLPSYDGTSEVAERSLDVPRSSQMSAASQSFISELPSSQDPSSNLGSQDVSRPQPSNPILNRNAPTSRSEHYSRVVDPQTSSFQSTSQKRRSFPAPRPSTTNEIQGESHNPNAPTPKRRRLEGEADNDHTRVSNGQHSLSSSTSSPSQGPNCYTIWACGLWTLRNPGKKPSEHTIHELSCICKDPVSAVESVFEASEKSCDERQTPNIFTASACELWKLMNPGEKPAQWQEIMLSSIFGDSPKSLSDWFIRNSSSPPDFEDSGNWTMTHTRTSSDTEIALKWRYNRKCCHQKSGKQAPLGKDPQRKYICSSLCGATFDSKENWKKHEQNNRVQELWLCNIAPCHQIPGKGIGWSRKDQLTNHVKKRHPGHQDEVQEHGIKIRANVRGNCLWRDCYVTFQTFDEFLLHIVEHFDKDWVAADLRDAKEETDAPEDLLSTNIYNQDPNIHNSDHGDDGPPPPNSGAGDSSGHQSSSHPQPGSGNSQSGQGNAGAGNSRTVGYEPNTHSGNVMQLATASSFKSLHNSASALLTASRTLSVKHIWYKMASLSPKIDFLGRLGSGSTAVVDEVRVSGVSGTMACKTFPAKWRPEVFRELETMSKLQHPHIVKLVYGCLEAGSTAILMQPVADYNLSQYLAACASTASEKRNIWVWFSCLTSGLQHMHKNGVRHQDIKPSNILVKDKNVLFADFGSSATIENDRSRSYHTLEFTDLYAAPEVFSGERRMASDVFSLGCVFLEMATILLSRDLWQELRLLQERSHQDKVTTIHWACKWNQTLLEFASHMVTETNVQVLLCVCQTMTDPQPEQRPSTAEIEKALNSQLRRPCSYSPMFNSGKKAYTWPMDQPAIEELQPQSDKEQSAALANKTSQAEVDEISQTSQEFETMTITDSSTLKTNTPRDKGPGNATIEELDPGSNGEKSENMMSTFLHHRDQREEFRTSGKTEVTRFFGAAKRSRFKTSKVNGALGSQQWSIMSSNSFSALGRLSDAT